VVLGGQFGSEGKGLAAAWLAGQGKVDVATTNAGAQSGHTTRWRDGRKLVCYHLPTVGVLQGITCYLNAGSVISPEGLVSEMLATKVNPSLVTIHSRAAIIDDMDRRAEGNESSPVAAIASTQKGVGEALSRKIRRSSPLAYRTESLAGFISEIDLNAELKANRVVTVEIPQGTDLSLNGEFYPYCTSRDCTVGAGLSDAGIHPSFLGDTIMVVRTYPIRVGNLVGADKREIGFSGPFWPDSRECKWDEFEGVEPEKTTVTGRVRRIATWSDRQYAHALQLNRPTVVMLNFVNYLKSSEELLMRVELMRAVEWSLSIHPTHLYCVGPCVEDVLEIDEAYEWLKTNR
jgi:adenylosuccinate synthase